MSSRQLFGAILSVVLLATFVYLLWIAFDVARDVVANCVPSQMEEGIRSSNDNISFADFR